MIADMNAVDKELLHACAKVCGYEVIGYHAKLGLRVWNEDHTHGFKWNPLYDDGDALRLACKIGLQLFCHTGWVNDKNGNKLFSMDDFEWDNIRLAIVRAAAEISKNEQ